MRIIPAHKQTDPDKLPGQQVNPATEQTLGDYIKRKELAMGQTKEVKKLTFDEWYSQAGWAALHAKLSLDDADSCKYLMHEAWHSAQENK